MKTENSLEDLSKPLIKSRERTSFTSIIEDQKWFTQICLVNDLIYITTGKNYAPVWSGTVAEFKELGVIKAKEFDKVYQSILNMAEMLINTLKRKES